MTYDDGVCVSEAGHQLVRTTQMRSDYSIMKVWNTGPYFKYDRIKKC